MGLCSGRSEQGTATQQSRALFAKGLGSNLSFGINVKTAVNSFRVEIRGAESQQRRDYGRRSDSMVPQKKKPMRALNTGWAETIKETIVCLILAAFRETRLRTVFVNKQDYSKQISGSNTSIYS